MRKVVILLYLVQLLFTGFAQAKPGKDREYWVKTMIKIIDPFYTNLSQNTLRKNMPVETFDGLNNGNTRKNVTHLEALGRSFNGISAWLNLPPDGTKEGQLRAKYTDLVVKSISNAVNPDSSDYMRFDGPGGQPLVDAAFFAQGLLRSKDQIWPKLDKVTQERIIKELKASRRIKASESNWLMFSATIEAALLEFTGECELNPIHYALKRHKEWYKGDGWYGDGRNFHLDYYNSYVIQPMLIDVLSVMKKHEVEGADFYDVQLQRLIRYADQQEKMISPEGTYPVLGRSMGLLRSKDQIWPKLDKVTQERIIKELKASRRIKASESNWLMFSATIEAALLEFTGECELNPIHYALKRHKEWYKGDGWYGDGRNFHLDYYNSYVIQPMLIDVLSVMKKHEVEGADFYDVQLQRLIRYADQQEKMISPEGTYPVLGRSMGYRFGAFQVLAQVSWMKLLPEHIKPAQVRCALTKVMKRQLIKGTFDKDGWLNLGFCGHQPEIADRYVSTGSNYLCTFIFLPLGLQADDEFWTAKPEEWSSVKIWSGSRDIKKDGSIKN